MRQVSNVLPLHYTVRHGVYSIYRVFAILLRNDALSDAHVIPSTFRYFHSGGLSPDENSVQFTIRF